jgi:hypothetical protein
MVLSNAPRRVRQAASLTSKGCHFGSMPGIAPSVGRSSAIALAYKQAGMTCDCLGKIKYQTCGQQYQYLKDKNLIFNCKLTGGTGRQPWTKNCAST